MSIQAFDLDVKTVAPQENVGGGESNAFISVEEAVVISERLHQCGCFLFDGIVIASLGTKNCGLNRALVADTMKAAKQLDQPMLYYVDFRYREVIRHSQLFVETPH